MSRIYIGIDPGKEGALAVLWPDGGKTLMTFGEQAYQIALSDVASRMADGNEAICCLEKVSAMPGQGVTSMFNFGDNFGLIRGLLTAFQIPYELVRPQKWKKEYSLSHDKKASIDTCKRLFPNISLRRTERCTTDHDGMAEALLMAEYARRKL